MTFKILVVEDDSSLRQALEETLKIAGYKVLTASNGREGLNVINEESEIALVVSDIQMQGMDGVSLLNNIQKVRSELPVILMTAYGSIEQAVDAMRLGALDYLVKPFEPEVLVSKVSQYLPTSTQNSEGVVIHDMNSQLVFERARKVAKSDATVLISGESGVGKEVLVQYIHNHSNRSDKPFVAINCAAIPDNMLEAILFGYQKGAYTGAYKACPGKFEQAQGGTLLLDEISEMNLPLQAKLLRVLQEKEVERLGDHTPIKLDVRVIATSNRNMRQEVAQGNFREDLYYRLNVFPLNMPPLRQRPDDILPIAKHLLGKAAINNGLANPDLSQSAIEKLTSYQWPGNVRELDNVMQRALILQTEGEIYSSHLQFESSEAIIKDVVRESSNISVENIEAENLGDDLKNHEHRIILDTLKQTRGSRKTAAEKLGISPRTLRYKIAKMKEIGIAIPA